mmetsp:Transcript_7445/g.12583  ORF Transcript_7445/g.12583 Transcript_7445/m.12583 type:complete len:94 (-) Transcript_7445:1177-1458(-)
MLEYQDRAFTLGIMASFLEHPAVLNELGTENPLVNHFNQFIMMLLRFIYEMESAGLSQKALSILTMYMRMAEDYNKEDLIAKVKDSFIQVMTQ